jgi:hypothetical protein
MLPRTSAIGANLRGDVGNKRFIEEGGRDGDASPMERIKSKLVLKNIGPAVSGKHSGMRSSGLVDALEDEQPWVSFGRR